MVYITGWFLSYLTLWLRWVGIRAKFPALFALLFIGVIITIRNSGTDTHSYEIWLSSVKSDTNTLSLEPGFALVAELLLRLTGSEVWALRGIGVLFTLFLIVYWLRSDRYELNLITLYFIPAFVFQYGMNAVRAGLGLTLLLLAWQCLRRNKKRCFLVLALTSITFHYSMILPALLLAVPELKVKTRRQLLLLSFLILAALALAFLQQDYILAKLELYSSSKSPSSASGLSRITMLASLLLGLGVLPFKTKLRAWAVIFGLGVFFQGLAFVSYAGLRFLDLVAFTTPLVLLREFDHAKKHPGQSFWWGVGIAGIIGAVFFLRNALADYNGQLTGTLTPFLPYRTVFDPWP